MVSIPQQLRDALENEVPSAKQIEFFKADAKYIAYGGSRGG